MTFAQAITTNYQKYAQFEGKASLSEFWWWFLFIALVSTAISYLNLIEIGNGSVGSILSGIWGVAILLPTLAVIVRRLRDSGHDWKNIFWGLIPVAGGIILLVYLARPSKS